MDRGRCFSICLIPTWLSKGRWKSVEGLRDIDVAGWAGIGRPEDRAADYRATCRRAKEGYWQQFVLAAGNELFEGTKRLLLRRLCGYNQVARCGRRTMAV